MTEDETVGWHHQLNEHELEQAPGVGGGQESLGCGSPWGCKESDTTERLQFTSPLHCTTNSGEFYGMQILHQATFITT